VVLGAVHPEFLASDGVEGVELVATEAAAEEDLALDNGRRRQRPLAGEDDLPALLAAVLAAERDRVAALRLATAPLLLAQTRRDERGGQDEQGHRDGDTGHGTPPHGGNRSFSVYPPKGARV